MLQRALGLEAEPQDLRQDAQRVEGHLPPPYECNRLVGPAYKITTNRGTTELSRRGALWSCSGRGLRALLTQPVHQSSDDGRGGFVGIKGLFGMLPSVRNSKF